MTLEELLDFSADKAEALSDIELEAFFAPFLNVTHPDRDSAIYREKESSGSSGKKKSLSKVDQLLLDMPDEKRQMLLKMAKEEGLDLEDLL